MITVNTKQYDCLIRIAGLGKERAERIKEREQFQNVIRSLEREYQYDPDDKGMDIDLAGSEKKLLMHMIEQILQADAPEVCGSLDREELFRIRKLLKRKTVLPERKLYISDLHFFHENLNHQMDERGFPNVEEMNAHMIRQWNSKVREQDEVYVLGDFSVSDGKDTNDILVQLNGRICLIEGNHDKFLGDRAFDLSRLEWVRPYAEIRDQKRKVVLSHYPVFCYVGQYRKIQGVPDTYMLYGHVHNTYDEVLVNEFIHITRNTLRFSRSSKKEEPIPCNMINCFCMFSDYTPLTLDEWIRQDELRRQSLPLSAGERKQHIEQ